jgi:NTP pyrophosphatase (non-canonical NTP hydrolase)
MSVNCIRCGRKKERVNPTVLCAECLLDEARELRGATDVNPLNLAELRLANVARCGEVFHPIDSWSPTDWATALAGEAGETCNAVKKLRRLDDGTNKDGDPQTAEEAIAAIARELADTVIYADLLATRLRIDLSTAIREKFNAVSDARGSVVRL